MVRRRKAEGIERRRSAAPKRTGHENLHFGAASGSKGGLLLHAAPLQRRQITVRRLAARSYSAAGFSRRRCRGTVARWGRTSRSRGSSKRSGTGLFFPARLGWPAFGRNGRLVQSGNDL